MIERCSLTMKRTNCSNLWTSVSNIWEPFRTCVFWSIGSVHFWQDCWIPKLGALSDWKSSDATLNTNLLVSYMVHPSGEWNWNLLQHLLLHSALLHFHSILPPSPTAGLDKCCWNEYSLEQAVRSITWKLWKSRNSFIFLCTSTSRNDLLHLSIHWASLYDNPITPAVDSFSAASPITWHKPPPGWIALNSDGAVSTSSSLGSAGGLLRDDQGNWLGGFSKPLGITTVSQADLWGLFEGLNLAWSRVSKKFSANLTAATFITWSHLQTLILVIPLWLEPLPPSMIAPGS
ncbi:hypothetical protein F3Y22_tig00110271pilonHSYRG00197 [Hibiscus syriacus]|uniref:RNase H type-1 domain-containing protein n=1 Tax=Hibiscus syriacus TaxID=106335 RepID=A0A6A3B6G4_HIBSY|nr:hypothetical protein F3Y22_tig00110271pilonHSYRG00197 [Hibiscus syriacus]